MAIVKITPATEAINCKAGEHSKFQFNISNTTGADILYGIQIRADDDVDVTAWLTVDGKIEHRLEANSTSTVEVNVAPPVDLLKEADGKKSFTFKLRIYDAKNPESTVDSPTVSVLVKPAVTKPKPFPWLWIVIILAVVIVVGGLAAWLVTATGETASYRYYRFTVTEVRDRSARGSNMVQLAELNFFSGEERLTSAKITNPDGSNPRNEEPFRANDGNKSTKWLDFRITPLIYDFGSPVQVDSYQLITANDFNGRDPVRWKLEGSNSMDDPDSWAVLDDNTGTEGKYEIPEARFTATDRIALR